MSLRSLVVALPAWVMLWERRAGVRGRRRITGRAAVNTLHVNGAWLQHGAPGARRYAAEMVKAIAAQGGWQVILHVPAAVTDLPPWTVRDGIEIRRARCSGVVFEQCHLPLVTAGRLLLNFSGTAPLLKRRQLVTMHDATPFRRPAGFRRWTIRLRRMRYRWLARGAAGLVTVSLFSAHELSDVLRVAVDRFLVAGGAADSLTAVSPSRPAMAWSTDRYLMIGNPARHKNIPAALGTVTGSGRKVTVVSGRLTDAELVWLYRHSRALIFPSTYEGFGLPPLEAQALGCPVVCSDSAALPEVCRDAALYFDPDDPQMLLAQLDRLETETELVEQLQRRGLANARRYSWADSAQQVTEWCRRYGQHRLSTS